MNLYYYHSLKYLELQVVVPLPTVNLGACYLSSYYPLRLELDVEAGRFYRKKRINRGKIADR